MASFEFKGFVVLITGGTSGIGLATARALGRAGASVAVAARGAEGGARALEALRAEGANAIVGMSQSVAIEWASKGVRVNALCPGVTAAPAMLRAEAAAPEIVRQLIVRSPIERMAKEAEIANAALWLCSPGATYVTGAVIAVDGGFLAA
jgi:NAD(P)-dependent dehydrogenase (short-subunit alcohol dehydrogenase family)